MSSSFLKVRLDEDLKKRQATSQRAWGLQFPRQSECS